MRLLRRLMNFGTPTIVCGAIAAAACSKPPPKPVEPPKPELTLQTARGKRHFDDKDKIVRKYDTNRDGDPDIWKVYKKGKGPDGREIEVLERAELDLNFDRRIDVWRFYGDKGDLVREELDLDFDGKIDVAILYENGKVAGKEYSQGFDERVSVWKTYENGQLVRIARMTDPRMKQPDKFELYEDGELAAIGWDRDGDGKPDVWEKVGEKKKAPLGAGDGGAGAATTPQPEKAAERAKATEPAKPAQPTKPTEPAKAPAPATAPTSATPGGGR